MMSVRRRRHGKDYLAKGKSLDDSKSEDEEVGRSCLDGYTRQSIIFKAPGNFHRH